jgi:chitosanase
MRLSRRTALLAGLSSVLLQACVGGVVSPEARQVAIEDKVVSIFENSTPLVQYAFIANLNDGRGYTAGRAGFTSGTGDMLEVVKEYRTLASDNVLVKHLPALLLVNGSASVAGLEGLPKDWALAAGDARFIAAQDNVNEREYRKPARALATALGVRLPLSRLAIYETGIQHGFGVDPDSVNKIAERASTAVQGSPAKGLDEKKWLQSFLSERRKTLLNPADRATAAGWAASVSRADAIQSLYDKGNFMLEQPITITVYGDTFTL